MSERRGGALGLLLWVAAAGVLPAVAFVPAADAVIIRLINGDGPNEGFNDPTPVKPIGGNTGTTRGAQRLIVFQRAVDMWALALDSPVEIRIGATFDPLQCDANSVTLGQAGPVEVFSDFAGAPLPNTFYSSALADRLAGMDLDPSENDIEAQFNSNFGTTCAFPAGWYYGLDGAGPTDDSDLLTVVLHELGHGMGFLSFVCFDNSDGCAGVGALFMNMDDAFSDQLVDDRTNKTFPQMTDAERASAMVATGHLKWDGAEVIAASGKLTTGADASGRVEMYAPPELSDGSSVSHWSDVLTPDELMEWQYTGPIHDIGLAAQALADTGWNPPGLVAGCAADCDGDNQVTINEIISAVGIALGSTPLSLCPAADSNRDGSVEVNELVGGVANALNGCGGSAAPTPTSTTTVVPTVTPPATPPDPTPTPTGSGCPVSFQDNSLDQKLLCLYAGTWNASCGDNMLQVGFQSDGTTFVAVLATQPEIGLIGNVSSPQAATLGGWFTDFTNLSDLQLLSGSAVLSDDGSALQIAPDSPPFAIIQDNVHCDFADYQGTSIGIQQGGSSQQIDTQRVLALLRQRLGQP